MDNKSPTGFSEKRRARRILVPLKSTALFSDIAGFKDKFYVKDLSVIGMLLCDYFNSAKKHPVNSSIYNIYVDIPARETNGANETSFLIEKAKVVRSFTDQSTGTICYGIEFSCDSPDVKRKIERLVGNA